MFKVKTLPSFQLKTRYLFCFLFSDIARNFFSPWISSIIITCHSMALSRQIVVIIWKQHHAQLTDAFGYVSGHGVVHWNYQL
jgi:hypothetical protein